MNHAAKTAASVTIVWPSSVSHGDMKRLTVVLQNKRSVRQLRVESTVGTIPVGVSKGRETATQCGVNSGNNTGRRQQRTRDRQLSVESTECSRQLLSSTETAVHSVTRSGQATGIIQSLWVRRGTLRHTLLLVKFSLREPCQTAISCRCSCRHQA